MLLAALTAHLQHCQENAPELVPAVLELIRLANERASDGDEPARYRNLGPIGRGGMAEIRRVRDRRLQRDVAMKIGQMETSTQSAARFLREAQATAQLQHPDIVPVYDVGHLPDGQLYFTMKEVQGQTLSEVIREVHAHARALVDRTETGWSFRRLLSVVHRTSLAVSYAHEQGLIHRDLKPDNIMVGRFGEVQVMDWGLVKRMEMEDASPASGTDTWDTSGAGKTMAGRAFGTPAYMAPEQARGQRDQMGPRTDIYGLGAVLYEVLSGRPPYEGADSQSVWASVIAGPPPPPVWSRFSSGEGGSREASSGRSTQAFLTQLPPETPSNVLEPRQGDIALPEALIDLCERAMSRSPEDRHESALAFADSLGAWLDGTQAHERAQAVVREAESKIAEIENLKVEAQRVRTQARAVLKEVSPWEWTAEKAAGWALEDQAASMEQQAARLAIEREHRLQGALTHAAELPEAHAALAAQYLREHRQAEQARDEEVRIRSELLLDVHVGMLPTHHPLRAETEIYLRGDGVVSVVTEPPGAEVILSRYVREHRRQVLEPARSLGRTPLTDISLPMGSYQCVLRAEGCEDVIYPVAIDRGARWEGLRPGSRDPHPIDLPRAGSLGPDDCYVPAGWFASGGDPEASNSLPGRHLWCDAFIMRRFPVTNADYIEFLDDLVATGREEEALRHVPRQPGGRAGELGAMIYGRNPSGRFELVVDADGDCWLPDWPVVLVDWHGAWAYAAWTSARDGLPWRLPGELEWEKAARGVDGRIHPWGDGFDPSWTCMSHSHPGRRLPVPVDSFPIDESPYGVRGMAGNVMEWTQDLYRPSGPPLEHQRVLSMDRPELPLDADRTRRGGGWNFMAMTCRGAYRGRNKVLTRFGNLGFRLARSWRRHP